MEGFHPAACVMIVSFMPAPLIVMPAFGSRGSSSSNVPAATSIVAPSAPSRTAATRAGALSTTEPAETSAGFHPL